MLIAFMILATVLTLIALGAVIYPLLFTRVDAQADKRRQEMVTGILRQQLKDVERDYADGKLSLDEYEETKLEIERRALDEVQNVQAKPRVGSSTMTKLVAWALVVVIPISAVFGYLMLGRYTAMDEHFLAMMQTNTKTGHNRADMVKMAEDLQAQLQKAPQNAEGWWNLAQINRVLGRYKESYEALEHLNAIYPNDPVLLSEMADMLASGSGGVMTPQALEFAEKALRIDPRNWKACALIAISYYQREQYKMAVEYWEKTILNLEPNDPLIEQFKANIEEAKRVGGLPAETTPVTKAPANLTMTGVVDLDPSLMGKLNPDDMVFIYARPEDSKMPLNLVRTFVRDLPYRFTLNEASDMTDFHLKLSDKKRVIVGARTSSTQNFMLQKGDAFVESEPVDVGTKNLQLMLKDVAP